MFKYISGIVLVLFCLVQASANHMVGGEIQMHRTGSANFEIKLIQFWERKNLVNPTPSTAGNRDVTVDLYIYRKRDNKLMDKVVARYRSTKSIEYQNKACATYRSMETLIGVYTGIVSLPSARYNDTDGYYIAWERCCRNDDINNIVEPGDNGMVFYLEFPPVSTINSSPDFLAPNGEYICAGRNFSMNMSAEDADGDKLRYSLVTPMKGHTNPSFTIGDDTEKSGYPLVNWQPGISVSNMIPGPSPLTIDENTGVISVRSNQLGLYVFTVQCEEFRNGRKIGLVRRDFQLLVIDCNSQTPEPPIVTVNGELTTAVKFCPQKLVELKTSAGTDWSYQWQLNGFNIPGATGATLMVKDTGQYMVVKSFKTKCTRDTSSVTVYATYGDPVPAKIDYEKSVLCPHDSIVLLANAIQSFQNTIWTKNGEDLARGTASTTITSAGLYHLTIQDSHTGCSGTDSVRISEDVLTVDLPEAVTIQLGRSVTLVPVIKPLADLSHLQWSPSAILSESPVLVVSPEVPTVYTVTVTSVNNCTSTASTSVNVVDQFYVPNIFSPDGDGKNDTFQISNIKDQILSISIYDRWGMLIFHSNGYEVPWNGDYNGQKVQPGSYPYIIRSKTASYKGEIMVVR
ncbi:hypothetical protein DYBT9275_01804 [Dyadobacter sp. CECT 9275]|uniref:Gliding motility-associated C-terminal domain-containing protein n=1 Tax=Dyadobacter helix TaxID=2822344 RepID=A0A916NBE4_9BACT|nr:gliding motility-associated C-terminal domain-containing protein [Dyadobacter sp. CECT 9275]CAG4997577.1 hypothetical protein DYBT9275_01804 [Dyadobacter sp. CECT 9275]